MPVDSGAQLSAEASEKSLEILGRIAGTFAQKGFDGASMQDLAAAAEMSVGNFYRYYPSKFAIMAALVSRNIRCMQTDFAAVRYNAEPIAQLERLFFDHFGSLSQEDAALWVQIQAAAIRHPEIAELKREMEETVRENIVAVLLAASKPKRRSDDPVIENIADLLILTVDGLFQRIAFEGNASFDRKIGPIFSTIFAQLPKLLARQATDAGGCGYFTDLAEGRE